MKIRMVHMLRADWLWGVRRTWYNVYKMSNTDTVRIKTYKVSVLRTYMTSRYMIIT